MTEKHTWQFAARFRRGGGGLRRCSAGRNPVAFAGCGRVQGIVTLYDVMEGILGRLEEPRPTSVVLWRGLRLEIMDMAGAGWTRCW